MKRTRILTPVLLAGGLLLTALPTQAEVQSMTLPGIVLPAQNIPQFQDTRMQAFYDAIAGQSVWFDAEGEPYLLRQQQLEAWITLSYEQGLNPLDYGVDRLAQGQLAALGAQREHWLTRQFLRLAQDLAGAGKVADTDRQWYFAKPQFDTGSLARQLAQGESVTQVLNALLPQSAEYGRLQTLYRDLLRQQDTYEPELALPDRLLRPGDRHEVIPQLRQWLEWQQWLAPSSEVADPNLYAQDLVEAVRQLQQRNGLKPDAILGPDTRAAMQRSVQDRLLQVRANLFRWRALPHDLGERYLLVRTGVFNLDLIENDALVRRHQVITGRPSRPTPSFAARVERLTLNPYWTVPFRIAVQDILPKQQTDGSYLSEHQIDVLERSESGQWQSVEVSTIDWSSLSRRNFNYLLKQRPGPGNSLGRMRMDMPNPYSIYLHDTPQQRLFEDSPRAFSSGCVRVQDIAELGQLLAGEERVEQGLAQTGRKFLSLEASVPVYLVYLTAWVDEAGVPYFYPDLYGRDNQLQQALGPIPAVPDTELVELARNVIKK